MLPDFRIRQRDYLLEITRAITQELDLDILLGRILKIAVEMLAGQAGLVALRSAQGGWRVAVTHGMPSPFRKVIESFLVDVPDHEDPERFEIPEINRLLNNLTFTASLGLLTGVGLPLIARQKVVGLLFIFRGYAGVFSSNDHSLLSSFANQAAIAVQNAQLYTQSNQEKERVNALLDTLADGILILDAKNRVERCNPAFSRMVNLPGEQILGNAHDQVVQWAQPPQDPTLEQAEADGWPLTPHAHLYIEGDLKRTGNEPPLPVGATYAPLISAEGNLLNIIVTLRDITRYRQAEELKSTFISIISHELKTPVALIKGYVSTLRREDAQWDTEIIRDSLAVIEEEADRLTSLIENLLDASRLQAGGGMALNLTDVAVPDVAQRMAKRLQTQTTQHTIVVNFPPDFPIILADEARVEQVLSNLIGNSIKYSPEGEIKVSGQVRQDSVIVCVSDTGPGIAPQDIPHVFDRFYRAPDMARQTKGAGLGLFLARAVVEAHNGHIWVDTAPGQGVRFCFSLPIQPGARQPSNSIAPLQQT
jgi:signal transduction histidine kinase